MATLNEWHTRFGSRPQHCRGRYITNISFTLRRKWTLKWRHPSMALAMLSQKPLWHRYKGELCFCRYGLVSTTTSNTSRVTMSLSDTHLVVLMSDATGFHPIQVWLDGVSVGEVFWEQQLQNQLMGIKVIIFFKEFQKTKPVYWLQLRWAFPPRRRFSTVL